jgi:light-harvesting protein B-800-850 alpha chain
MNNAKMWLVVPPAVGVPIFLGAVAVGSFAVHVAVLTNTSWVSDFLSGVPLGTGDTQEASAAMLDGMRSGAANAAYTIPSRDGSQQVLVILPDGTTAIATLEPGQNLLASSAPSSRIIQH